MSNRPLCMKITQYLFSLGLTLSILLCAALSLTSCTESAEKTKALDAEIAATKVRLNEIRSQFGQYSGVTALEPLVRARYLITLQTLDMLEQRRAAAFYDVNLSYVAKGGALAQEKDLYEKDLALQEARSNAALKRTKAAGIVAAGQVENLDAYRWQMLLLDLQMAQLDYRLTALRYRFPEVVGEKEFDSLIKELAEKYDAPSKVVPNKATTPSNEATQTSSAEDVAEVPSEN